MKLSELQDKLGEQIELLTDDSIPHDKKSELMAAAQVVSSLAKQMINNADVILRTEKLTSEGKLKDSRIEKIL